MAALHVARLTYNRPLPVGVIAEDGSSFTYDASYLNSPQAIPLSLSLPLRHGLHRRRAH